MAAEDGKAGPGGDHITWMGRQFLVRKHGFGHQDRCSKKGGSGSGNALHRTIFAMGISRMSTAPAALRPGIRVLTFPFWTTVWML